MIAIEVNSVVARAGAPVQNLLERVKRTLECAVPVQHHGLVQDELNQELSGLDDKAQLRQLRAREMALQARGLCTEVTHW